MSNLISLGSNLHYLLCVRLPALLGKQLEVLQCCVACSSNASFDFALLCKLKYKP